MDSDHRVIDNGNDEVEVTTIGIGIGGGKTQ